MVDFFLGLAIDLKGDGFTELEIRASVESGERLPVEFETDRQHRAFFMAMNFLTGLAVVSDGGDFCVIEDCAVVLRSLFSLTVEPQAGCELLNM
ncbi:hypothetical protein D9M71_771150 [compost metagenome]